MGLAKGLSSVESLIGIVFYYSLGVLASCKFLVTQLLSRIDYNMPFKIVLKNLYIYKLKWINKTSVYKVIYI